MKTPLSYSVAAKPVEAVAVRKFPDGGVTIMIPPPPRPTRRQELATVVVCGVVALVVLLATRISPLPAVRAIIRGFSAIVHGMLASATSQLCSAAILAFGVVLLTLVWLSGKVRQRPTTIGMSRKSVYLDTAGMFRRINVLAPRWDLREIKPFRYRNSLSRHPTSIEIVIAHRLPVYICSGRPHAEIDMVLAALRESVRCTHGSTKHEM